MCLGTSIKLHKKNTIQSKQNLRISLSHMKSFEIERKYLHNSYKWEYIYNKEIEKLLNMVIEYMCDFSVEII